MRTSSASWVRLGLALLLIVASIAKLVHGMPVALEAMRMFKLSDSSWPQLSRGVQAVAVLELLLATAMLAFAQPRRWMATLLIVEVAFIAWDALRYATGGAPDCGCFGGITLATSWLHVALKHVLLLALIAYLWFAVRRSAPHPGAHGSEPRVADRLGAGA